MSIRSISFNDINARFYQCINFNLGSICSSFFSDTKNQKKMKNSTEIKINLHW